MRRVLFLSYWVPPRTAIGAVRSSHVTDYLRRFGWDVTVVTARFSDKDSEAKRLHYIGTRYFNVRHSLRRIIHLFGLRKARNHFGLSAAANGTRASWIRRILDGAFDLLTYRDEHVGWLPFATYAIRRLIDQGGWDAVLSTAPPMTANVAAALGHRTIPWVADLRDLWAEDDSTERSTLQVFLDDRFERMVLSSATALIASSELSAARFQRRYPSKPCYGIFTGFDPKDWQSVAFCNERECTLLYAGTLYRGKRDPGVLFDALRSILDEGLTERHELRVDFYTPAEAWLVEMVRRFQLEDIVNLRPLCPREAIMAAERRADRLIIFSWDGLTAEGVVPGKLFEYFGARRPIMAMGGPPTSEVERLLKKTGAGVRCSTVAETKNEVLNALREHRDGIPRIIDDRTTSDYTAESCARQFAEALDRTIRC